MGRSSGAIFKKRKAFNFCGRKVQHVSSAVEENHQEGVSSASHKKLNDLNESYGSFNSVNNSENVIIELELIASVFENVCCKNCQKQSLKLMRIGKNSGLAVKLQLYCENCDFQLDFFNSSKHGDEEKLFCLNTRLVYGFRAIGKGAAAATLFCGMMNLPPPPTRFATYNKTLKEATELVCKTSMTKAVEEAVQEIENSGVDSCRNIAVAVDGTWQKRSGFSSKNGVVSATSMDTGKVVDVEILSKHCICGNKNDHEENCKRNFEGSSGRMEVEGALAIFQRSESQYSVKYVKYLGDGDTKAFSCIQNENVYGTNFPVEKLECVGHVMKRMGCRLRRLVKSKKGTKLSDNKALSGRNRLTDAQIDKLQLYYGLAIRRNTSNLDAMRQAVWAVYLHKVSTDQSPQHGFCPKGKDSWCGYQKALATERQFTHKNSLPVAVMEAIKPIFRDLSHPDLLRKCLHGKTQNPNESLNNIIWSRIPKTVFVHLETLKFGVYDAVSVFNEGNIVRCQVFQNLGIQPGMYCLDALKSIDNERLRNANRDCLASTKEARLKRKKTQLLECEHENSDYECGAF